MQRLLGKTNPSPCRRGDPISKYISSLGTNKNLVMDFDGVRKQEPLSWRRPAARYCDCDCVKSGYQSVSARRKETVGSLNIEAFPSNGHLRGACLTALFQFSAVISHVTCVFIWYCNSRLFWLQCSGFQEVGGMYRHETQT